jgi:hypothetical protein
VAVTTHGVGGGGSSVGSGVAVGDPLGVAVGVVVVVGVVVGDPVGVAVAGGGYGSYGLVAAVRDGMISSPSSSASRNIGFMVAP